MHGTVAAIERELMQDGLVCRYPSRPGADGLPPGEGVFLACSFWMANTLARIGRRDEARALLAHVHITSELAEPGCCDESGHAGARDCRHVSENVGLCSTYSMRTRSGPHRNAA